MISRNKGFQVAGTVNACTKGIWLWPQLLSGSSDSSQSHGTDSMKSSTMPG